MPEITRLILMLRDMGALVDDVPYTVDDAVNTVLKLIKEQLVP